MTGPAWLTAIFASLMLLISASGAARLAIWRLRVRQTEPDIDGLHLFMGVAMAGMLESRLSPVPYTAWLAVFATGAAWFSFRSIRARTRPRDGGRNGAHHVPHAVECATMIYMLLPGSLAGHGTGMAMPGMTTPAANPAVALILALFMLGYILWSADQLTARSPGRGADVSLHTAVTSVRPCPAGASAPCPAAPSAHPAAAALAPRLTACTKIVMSIAMAYMLIGMV